MNCPWLLPLVLFVADPATAPIPAGDGKAEAVLDKHTIELFTYKPKLYKDGPLIIVFHGMLRNADVYRDNGKSMGDRFGALIVAPLFDQKRFPNPAYQEGGLLNKGEPQPTEAWTWSLVPTLIDSVRRREGRPQMPVYLVGHSAGGQFLSRMSGFVTTDSKRIVAANPGSHLFPTRDLPFPYGYGKLPAELNGDAALKRCLAQPLTIYLGTGDTGLANLPQSATAKQQGANRYERGKKCFQLGEELARTKGWKFNWRIVEAPEIGHDAKAMFAHERCTLALFGKTP